MNLLRPFFLFLSAGLLLTGCRTADHSPTIDIIGSYFPAWVICIVCGIGLTLVTRQIFIGLKLNTHLRPIALVYLCLAISYTLAVWLLFFEN